MKTILTNKSNYRLNEKDISIYIDELSDFISLIESFKIKVIFKGVISSSTPIRNGGKHFFYLIYSGFIFWTSDKYFEDIDEAMKSHKLGFKDYKSYEMFLNSDADSIDEYKFLLENNFKHKTEYINFLNLGLEHIYTIKNELINNEDMHKDIRNTLKNIKDRKSLYLFYFRHFEDISTIPRVGSHESNSNKSLNDYFKARNNKNFSIQDTNFKVIRKNIENIIKSDYRERKEEVLIEFINSGYNNVEAWIGCDKNGFVNEDEIIEATNRGFILKKDYDKSLKLGIQSFEQYTMYMEDLKYAKNKGYKSIEIYLANNLQDIHTFNRFSHLFRHILNNVKKKYGETYKYSSSFKSIKFFSDFAFLWNNEPIEHKLNIQISSDSDNMIPQKYAVDASNVCWFRKNMLGDNTLHATDLLNLRSILNEYGIENIIFIADANLRYEVEDPDILESLVQQGVLKYSHNEPADKILLSLASRGYAIITNDKFRDWLDNDDNQPMSIGFSIDKEYGIDLV